MPPQIIEMLKSFFLFLRARNELIHLLFIRRYQGVVVPPGHQGGDEDGLVASLDLSATQKDDGVQVSDWGLKFRLTQPVEMWTEFPWDSILIVSNEYGLAWANKPMLVALGMTHCSGEDDEDSATEKPKYLM